jgi:hypothetical protein
MGAGAGLIHTAATFPDWVAYGRNQEKAEFRRVLAELLKVVERVDNSIIIGGEAQARIRSRRNRCALWRLNPNLTLDARAGGRRREVTADVGLPDPDRRGCAESGHLQTRDRSAWVAGVTVSSAQNGGGPTTSQPCRSATAPNSCWFIGSTGLSTISSNSFPALPGVYMNSTRPVSAPVLFQACATSRGMKAQVPARRP